MPKPPSVLASVLLVGSVARALQPGSIAVADGARARRNIDHVAPATLRTLVIRHDVYRPINGRLGYIRARTPAGTDRPPSRPGGGKRESDARAVSPRSSDARRDDPTAPTAEQARERFRAVDSYRANREWNRYEGTPQRDLFREIRERFLDRHRVDAPWALEIGPGPGRFTHRIGADGSRRVLIDLSDVMLRRACSAHSDRTGERFSPDPVRGDGFRPPVRSGAFGEVTALGNVLGFAPEPFARSLQLLAGSAAPGAKLLLEIMPGTGERSRYLARLPPRAVGRLLRSPVGAVRPRIEHEGFVPVDGRAAKDHGFRRRTVADLVRALSPSGWAMREAMAVAPALGSDPDRIAEVRPDPNAWNHLLEIEEGLGRLPERWERCAAVMVAFELGPAATRSDAR